MIKRIHWEFAVAGSKPAGRLWIDSSMVERLTVNQGVVSSNLTRSSNYVFKIG